MRCLIVFLVPLLFAATAAGGESVSVPWEEFKVLYRESIERQVRKEIPEESEPWCYVLEDAAYEVRIHKDKAECTLLVSGRPLSGRPAPIPLLGGESVLVSVDNTKGGALLASMREGGGFCFLPAGTEPFQLALHILHPIQEDSRSKLIRMRIHPAVRNSLKIELEDGLSINEAPGIPTAENMRYFSSTELLMIRFSEAIENVAELKRESIVEVDTITTFRVQEEKIIATSLFQPRLFGADGLILHLPEDAQFIGTSLRASWVHGEENGIRLRLPESFSDVFSLQFAVPQGKEKGEFNVMLPFIEKNTAREGDFILIGPEGGQVEAKSDLPIQPLLVSDLRGTFRRTLSGTYRIENLPPPAVLHILVRPYAAVKTAPVVLDCIEFYTAFEENGGALSVLRFDAPPVLGSRLVLKSIPGVEIWSLRIDGKMKNVYTQATGEWILPLASKTESSRVELALLCRGKKLGLQGKLDTTLPALGLPARQVLVGLALPHRVELLNVEGPVNPYPCEMKNIPAEFVGHRYYFARSFHQGDSIRMTFFYKEPVKK